MRLGLKAFDDNPGGHIKRAIANDEPIEITFRNNDYATVNPATRQQRLEQSDDIVQGLLRLAYRGAHYSEYQAYAEALEQMAQSGHLNLSYATESTTDGELAAS